MNRQLACSLFAGFFGIPGMMAGQTSPEHPAATLRTYTNLVIVDVVVTDAHQHPIHHLSANDFTLLEDGHAQTIKVFEEHAACETAKPASAPKADPGVFSNDLPVASAGPLNIILLDKLNTPVKDQAYVNSQLIDYLKKSHRGTRTAIF